MIAPRRRLPLLVIAAALLVAGVGMRLRDDAEPAAEPPRGELPVEAGVDAADIRWTREGFAPATPDAVAGQALRLPPGSDAGLPPLPPADLPLAAAFDALVERGKRGDATAACRLAVGLGNCSRARQRGQFADDLERDLARGRRVPERAIEAIARLEQSAETLGSLCGGLSDDQLEQAFDWQRQAAILSPRDRLDFILDPRLDRRDFLADLDRWAEYRRLALPWLEQAAMAGDPSAVIVAARVFGDHRQNVFLLPHFRVRDDRRFALYAALMDHHGVGLDVVRAAAAEARTRLSPEQQAALDAEIARLTRDPPPPRDADEVERLQRSSLAPRQTDEACAAPDG